MTIQKIVQTMSSGLGRTCAIFGFTVLFSLPLGLVIAALRMCKFKPVRYLTQVYISIMRGTPLMLQLLAVAYGPFYLFGATFFSRNKLIPITIAFSLNYAAYFAEIYRGGIEAMPKGQYEAAAVLGYNKIQTFIRIILPQVIKHILPSVTNEVITLVKDTSFAFTLSYTELFYYAKNLAANNNIFMPFIVAGVFYYIFNIVVAFVMSRIEKALNYYR